MEKEIEDEKYFQNQIRKEDIANQNESKFGEEETGNEAFDVIADNDDNFKKSVEKSKRIFVR